MIPRAVDVTGLDGRPVNLTAEQLDDLAHGSRVACCGPATRAGTKRADLERDGGKTPALVVQPASARDVAAAVGFARDHGLLLSIKGGGHNIAGTVHRRGRPDARHVRACARSPSTRTPSSPTSGRGACSRTSTGRPRQHGLATVLGFISEVGVAGLTLGGGLGYLARRFGWTVDNLDEVEIVTADGEIRTASRDQNADLFWAVRGGGGNFGVVTRFTFRLHEVGPTVYGGLIAWPLRTGRRDPRRLPGRSPSAAPARADRVRCSCFSRPPAPFVPEHWHGKHICAMPVCYSGDLADVDDDLAPIRALGDPDRRPARRPALHRSVQSIPRRHRTQGRALLLEDRVPPRLSDELLARVPGRGRRCPIPACRVGHPPPRRRRSTNTRTTTAPSATATPATSPGSNGMPGRRTSRDAAFRHGSGMRGSGSSPFSTGGNYINFQLADEDTDRTAATYGTNFDRLVTRQAQRTTRTTCSASTATSPRRNGRTPVARARRRDDNDHAALNAAGTCLRRRSVRSPAQAQERSSAPRIRVPMRKPATPR